MLTRAQLREIFASAQTPALMSATLSAGRMGPIGVQSSSLGFFAGGRKEDGSYSAVIDKLVFSSETRSVSGATLPTARMYGAGLNSSTGGYFAGGHNGTRVATIDAMGLAIESIGTMTTTLSPGRSHLDGMSSETNGYALGGHNGTVAIKTIAKVGFNTGTVQSLAGGLTVEVYGHACVSTLGN